MKYIIKTSPIIIVLNLIVGLISLINSAILIGLFFLFIAFLGYYKKIEINSFDAVFRSLFSRVYIKDIESIDVFGLGFLNRVKITGKGGSIIKMGFVKNFNEIVKLSEEIHLKHRQK